ncbi:metal-binding protein [Rhizobium sp. Leaf384]|uniref:YceD family protein n=1 Tax=unclassified Rhizobium TaxID=2613769 RepID=UPI000713770C|nr:MULTISPECIES: DUF177 domain-containing protein [unclassified Rhizobium]KQS80443.1 metal-binding protein [Rhizobium sp. Leaf384]KQS86492.1 metal-binding protein [Rhizobium sp. Leaf383]
MKSPAQPPEKLDDAPAYSHLVKVGALSASLTTLRLAADAAALEALARQWRVTEVRSLTAELQIARWKKDGVRVKGRVTADLVQECVVTLEPVESHIDEPVEATFVPDGSRLARALTAETPETVIDPDGPDAPDVFVGDTIDIGQTVAEHVAMAIDPYPKKPGAAFPDHIESTEQNDKRPNPFAALKDWKKD